MQPKHRDVIIDTLEEYERRNNFIRIYPAKGTDHYDKLFEVIRTTHKVVYKYLYGSQMDFTEKEISQYNMKPSVSSYDLREPSKNYSHDKMIPQEHPKRPVSKEQVKVLVTANDILIEYVERLVSLLKTLQENNLKLEWIKAIERFIDYEVSYVELSHAKLPLWKRLEDKLIDMKEHYHRFIACDTNTKEEQKQHMLKGFTANQLEGMLRSSSKTISNDFLSTLIPHSGDRKSVV